MIPFAEAVALSFTTPLFATIGAALILGERVRARRWTATLVGFAGVLVIVRPGSVALDWGAGLAILSMALSAGVTLIVKNLTRTERPDVIATYMVLIMTPMSLAPALFVWSWPAAHIWPWLVAMGAMGSCGHMCFLRSFALAEASAVMPYDYTRMVFAAVIGYVFFAEVPDDWTWVGAAIIAGAAIYIAHREAQLRQSAATLAGASAGEAPPPTGPQEPPRR
jgi:drug/metabolite transporter (DMT)-like permease